MGSPAVKQIINFIQIDRTSQIPIFLQIAQQVINAVQRSYLPTGTKLPGTRFFSEELGVHRKTIVAAFEELHAQGWIDIKPNKGAYIIYQPSTKIKERPFETSISLASYPQVTGFHFEKSIILNNPFEHKACTYHFTDGTPDIRLSPIHSLSAMYSASMKRKHIHKRLTLNYINQSEDFKGQLSTYLNLSRGLHIAKENILITPTSEIGLYIISKLLIKPNDTVIVGNRSHFIANMVFKNAGARMETIPVDAEGIDTAALRLKLQTQSIRLIYITPHHHYPTTVSLSAKRRVELLQLANEYGFAIIEDDYDYDFQYEKNAILPLASADTGGMVVYIGSFGQPLSTTLQRGFVVAPHNLIQEMHKHLGMLDRHGDIIIDQILAEMIAEGEIHRFLKKSNKEYKLRRDFFCATLHRYFGDMISFHIPSGGLACWIEWNIQVSLLDLAKRCLSLDLFVPKNLLYQDKYVTAMRIGFGHMNTQEIEASLALLKQAIDLIIPHPTK